MSKADPNSLERRVVEDYFHTTSAAGIGADVNAFHRSAEGLRRRLGRWLDVGGRDVVDLGSGTGELCWVIRDAGARSVLGVNLSKDEIEYARKRVRVEFVCQDIADYLVAREADSVDRIYALNILEHLHKNSLIQVLEEARRCLRADGALIAMVPNATSPFSSMTRYWDITHQLAFTPSSIRQLARLAGYESCEFRECGPVPHGFLSGIRYGLWQGIRALVWGYLMIELASSKGGIYTADMMLRLTKGRGIKG